MAVRRSKGRSIDERLFTAFPTGFKMCPTWLLSNVLVSNLLSWIFYEFVLVVIVWVPKETQLGHNFIKLQDIVVIQFSTKLSIESLQASSSP